MWEALSEAAITYLSELYQNIYYRRWDSASHIQKQTACSTASEKLIIIEVKKCLSWGAFGSHTNGTKIRRKKRFFCEGAFVVILEIVRFSKYRSISLAWFVESYPKIVLLAV